MRGVRRRARRAIDGAQHTDGAHHCSPSAHMVTAQLARCHVRDDAFSPTGERSRRRIFNSYKETALRASAAPPGPFLMIILQDARPRPTSLDADTHGLIARFEAPRASAPGSFSARRRFRRQPPTLYGRQALRAMLPAFTVPLDAAHLMKSHDKKSAHLMRAAVDDCRDASISAAKILLLRRFKRCRAIV